MNVIEILIGIGAFEVLREAAAWVFSRKRSKIDAAALLQNMSLEMVTELRTEVAAAKSEITELHAQARAAGTDVDTLARWARQALEVIEQHGLTVPTPVPPQIRRIH